jgi:GNAT superfamily N-acetyltransferase
MDISRVDPEDAGAVEALVRIGNESEELDTPYPVPHTPDEMREQLRNTDSSETVEGYLGTEDGRPVGTAVIEVSMLDNTDKAWFTVNVAPAERRRGHGSNLVSFAERRSGELDRTLVMSSTLSPLGADEDHPYLRFARRRGYVFSQAEVHRVLDLPADVARLHRLRDDAEPRHAGYTFAQYEGPLPEELLPDFCVLLNTMLTDAPSGGVEYEEGATTPAVLKEGWDLLRRQGRTFHTCVAFDENGSAVAHSQIIVPEHDPDKLFQWDTLVRRDHRGHRLGIATKVRNLLTVQGLHPQRTRIHTWNAESNTHMIAVNEAMGFIPVGRYGEYYKHLTG